MITQTELKRLLNYNSETGIFTWELDRRRIMAGYTAGTLKNSGYIHIVVNYKPYMAHRLAWLYITGIFPINQLDHINGNRNDNRFCNLREATNNQNQYNSVVSKNNKLRIKGVSKQGNKYQARARINYKEHYLGLYKTPEEASNAYLVFTKKHHGEFFKEAR